MKDEQQVNPGYYSVIPAPVRYDNQLPANAKLLYGEVTALAQREGYCWATNDYFAKLYHVNVRTVQRWITSLKNKGYITVSDTDTEKHRKIFLASGIPKLSTARGKNVVGHDKNVVGRAAKMSSSHDKNVMHNNNNEYTKITQQHENTPAVVVSSYLRNAKQWLIDAGVHPSTANRLTSLPDFPDEMLLRTYLQESTSKRNPTGYLIAAIQGHYVFSVKPPKYRSRLNPDCPVCHGNRYIPDPENGNRYIPCPNCHKEG